MDLKEWRLVIDLRDAIEKDGGFTSDIRNTIIHEMGHIITLNSEQILSELNSSIDSYVAYEGQLTKKFVEEV